MTNQMSKMLKYVSIFFIIVFTIYGAKKLVFWWFVSHYQPAAVTVSATTGQSKTWLSYLTATGTLSAINGVDISSESSGIVQEIRFKSGQLVKQGDIVIVMRTEAEEAELKSSQAKLQLAQINFNRQKTLYSKNVSAQAALDTSNAELLQAQAGVESALARIRQKIITAPFDGQTGICQVNIGQYISPGAVLVTLQSLNPLYVMFNLPERYVDKLFINQDVQVTVNLGDGKIVHGKITAINSKVDQTTRNMLVQATIPNDKFELYPGMYGLVKVWLKQQQNTLVVPQTAISYSLSGDYVFLIKNEGKSKDEPRLKVYRQYVKVGERRDNEAAILEGLKPGDKIVTSGQLKLQNGSLIVIDNSVEL